MGLLAALAAALCAWLGVPSSAAAVGPCPADSSYTGPCGPTFTLPQWGDAGGWKEPDQYQTIQFGDVLGNDREQLIGKSADGIEIWDFDTSLGQWRPAVNANGKPIFQPTSSGTYTGDAGTLVAKDLGGYTANALGLMNPEDWYFTK